MKDIKISEIADEVVQVKLRALKEVMRELVEPIRKVGSPEKVIGKPYEEWTPQDKQRAITIYGTKKPNPLDSLVFRKTYEKVKQMEQDLKV
jgi:hypothetical protein